MRIMRTLPALPNKLRPLISFKSEGLSPHGKCTGNVWHDALFSVFLREHAHDGFTAIIKLLLCKNSRGKFRSTECGTHPKLSLKRNIADKSSILIAGKKNDLFPCPAK